VSGRGLRSLGRLYLERQAFHVNANILVASLSGTVASAAVSAALSSRGWGPDAVAALGTATTALVFVPLQLALHYLVVRLQARASGEADYRRRYWRESRLIWATGLPAIAAFLALFTAGQSVMLRLLRPVAATATAYVIAQVLGRVVHTLLLRFTSMGRSAAPTAGQRPRRPHAAGR
jgi:hypothetical protein